MPKPTLTRILSLFLVLVFVFAGAVFLWPVLVGGPAPENAPVFPRSSLTFVRADGHSFPLAIEIATTPEQQHYGLMFRRSLPRDSGMLFTQESDRPISMWMKNTYIPLDMLFVRHDGTIAKIVTHAEPFNLTPISSDVPVSGVIEINAGEADRLGLKTGDKVLFPGFGG